MPKIMFLCSVVWSNCKKKNLDSLTFNIKVKDIDDLVKIRWPYTPYGHARVKNYASKSGWITLKKDSVSLHLTLKIEVKVLNNFIDVWHLYRHVACQSDVSMLYHFEVIANGEFQNIWSSILGQGHWWIDWTYFRYMNMCVEIVTSRSSCLFLVNVHVPTIYYSINSVQLHWKCVKIYKITYFAMICKCYRTV